MWSRREQHQAYQFLNRRIVSAIVTGEPETNELPMRRFGVGLFSGIVVGLLVVAGFTAYGMLVPGGGRPAANVIIVERDTGAIYLYVEEKLHPVANWTSARLILGQESPATKTLSQASLRDVPRGRPVGIPDAPWSLPGKASLVGLPWSVCTAPRSADLVGVATHVLVGWAPPVTGEMSAEMGLLVDGGENRFLIWQDHRLRIPDNEVLAALGWAGVRPAPVATAFLDAIPPGPDLTLLAVPGAGQPAPHAVSGGATTVGQMFRAADEYYVMLPQGLAAVGALTARLWQAKGRPVTDATVSDIAAILAAGATAEPAGLPDHVPTAVGVDDGFAMACAVYQGAVEIERPVTVEYYSRLVDGVAHLDTSPLPAGAAADRVALPGGRAALVRTLTPTSSSAPGTTYVITDQGIRYPLPAADTAEVQASLGYAGVEPVPVPASFLDLLPTGPTLDPQAASVYAEPGTGPAAPDPDTAGA
jgi:type VII secretion protein EccB